MYIEPNTNIMILKNVPLDTTYEHTIYFASAQAQHDYFASLVKFNLNFYTYQRVKRGFLKVAIQAEKLYDCNYIMFQNASFGTKWFYAYITSVEYVNNETSQITFEIDVMQTWHFDYQMGQCFVEREHVSDDTVGAHIEPEPVETGEYVFNLYESITNMQLADLVYILAVVDIDNGDGNISGNTYDRIYGAATLYGYMSYDVPSLNAKINEYIQKPDSIIAIYTCPQLIAGISSSGLIPPRASGRLIDLIRAPLDPSSDTIDGYKPKNNKLYTYPYNFYHVDNSNGSTLALRYEFFDNFQPTFQIRGTLSQPVQCVLRPTHYKNVYNTNFFTLNTESLELSNYPLCSWAFDAYQAWIAQNSIPLALSTISSVSQIAISGALGGVAGGVTSAIGLVSNVASQFYQASIAEDIAKGNFNSANVNVSSAKQDFYGGRCSITAEYARMIDDFFTMFGYAVKRCKVPNRNNRPHWNYVKTIGCVLKGSVPADDMKKICGIYDKGITFWKNGGEIGNYSLDNSI